MIRVRLQIGDGKIYDTEQQYNLVYVSSDNRFAAPTKEFETTSYPEQSGVNIHPKTTDNSFDYKVSFFVKANGSLENANQFIKAFNAQLYEEVDGVKEFKQVSFYNDYKKVKIVGYATPIQEATEFFRDSNGTQHDIVVVEWVIKVGNPNLCDFNLN